MNLVSGSKLNRRSVKPVLEVILETSAVVYVWMTRAWLGVGIRNANKESDNNKVEEKEWLNERWEGHPGRKKEGKVDIRVAEERILWNRKHGGQGKGLFGVVSGS